MELTFGDGTKGKYNPLQFHVHAPSEHTFNGEQFDMELHIVHQSASGELAVLGFYFTAANDKKSAFLDDIISKNPTAAGVTLDDLDLADFIHDNVFGHFQSYNGSLTTPPCTEGVRWTVVESPVDMSKEQKKYFDDMWKDNPNFANGKGNNRVVQPVNARVLIESPESFGHGGEHSHDDDAATTLGATAAALLAIAAMWM